MKAMRQFICILSLAFCVATHAGQFKIGAHNFTLPDGSPTVRIKGGLRRAVEFNYGNRGVEVWFYRDGRVVVRNYRFVRCHTPWQQQDVSEAAR